MITTRHLQQLCAVIAISVIFGAVARGAAAQTAAPIKASEVPQHKKIAPLAAARHVQAGADAVGRSGHRRRVHQQRRERDPVRAAGGVRRGASSTTSRPTELAKMVKQRQEQTIERDADAERVSGRDQPDALVRELLRRQQPRVARLGSAGRQGAAADRRRRSSARLRARQRARGARGPADSLGRPQPLRSLHHARHPGLDDAGHLRQLVPDPPGPGLRRDHLRDGARHARHPARRPAARRAARFASTSATRAATGKATRSSSRRPTSPTRRRTAARAST